MSEKENAASGQLAAGTEKSAILQSAPPHSSTLDPNGTTPHEANYQELVDANVKTADVLETENIQQLAEEALLALGAHDEGNAQCVQLRYHNQFLRNENWGWLSYVGTHWVREGAEAVLDRAIVDTLQTRIDAALKSGEADRHSEIIKKAIPTSARVKGAKYLLQSIVYSSPGGFNSEPDLLNCPNGVVDLRTGELSAHSPKQRFTYCTRADYVSDATTKPWVNWLNQAVDDKEIVRWLQLAVGYSLTGHTREEVLFYLYGPPRSGKGTFTETLLTLLGSPLAEAVSFDILTAPRDVDSQNFRLAPLHSSRLVAASESNQYERFNEAKLKSLTGGDSIQCAYKHHTPFSYRPEFKIWLASNQPVNADPDDDAVWGRLRVIHFPHSHLGKEDKTLKDRMRSPAVLEGVLAWAVQGAIRWHSLGRAGLPELESSVTLKQKQREKLDNIGTWMDDCCELGDHHFSASKELYSSYREWCQGNGVTPKQQRGFSESLQRKDFKPDRQYISGKRVRGFYGVHVDQWDTGTLRDA